MGNVDAVKEKMNERARKTVLIKDAIVRARKYDLCIDYKKLILTVMSDFYLSERMAKEYVEVALHQLGLSKESIAIDALREQEKEKQGLNKI